MCCSLAPRSASDQIGALLALELLVVPDDSVKPEDVIECAYDEVDEAET
jgi:hypothetical protein